MFRPVNAKPDLVAQEHEILALWRERQTFARLRAQNADGPRWSFLDGPITANNPMGVHHAWGRTYKDVFQRFHAMLGEAQRWQNGFDCQGLWVEVNVERDLGFTNKRDIEAYGIAEFVSLCKQRVLTYAARQTEQSIRLGMWMDWNDPDELRRLRDLLADDPAQPATIHGVDGPVTDSVEMLVGRLGMRDVGGSYFTFSNENNDLIWGFLAECHRRGWIYKGHDTMPWCARCGTGLSEMEMNEGYADREDPGLTVRFPLVDRPGEALLVWTTTPWTLTSNVAAAVGENLTYVRARQGDGTYWLAKGTLKTALEGPFEVLEERPGADLVGWRYEGPFDDLPAVRKAFAAGTRDEPGVPYRHRVVAWDEVGEDEGTGIVHIAPGCGSEDFQLGKELGLPVIAPLDENGIVVEGFGSLTRPRRPRRQRADRRAPQARGTLLPARAVHPPLPALLALRHAARVPARRRVVHQHGPGLRQAAQRADEGRGRRQPPLPDHGGRRPDPLDPGLRLRAGARLADQHARLDDQQEALLGPGAADLRLPGVRHVRRHRRARRAQDRAVDGWEAFEGHTPHRPFVDAVKIACPSCGAPVARIADVGNPWLDAGIVPFSTLHYREDPDYWAKWYPADFITESFPGQFRNWFYSMLAMGTVLRREPPFKTIFGYALVFGEDGRPMHKSWGNAIDFDEAAERMGVDVMRWLFATARPEENIRFGWHAADEARRELLVLWNVYSFFVTYARSPAGRRRAGAGCRLWRARTDGRPSIAGSCRGRPAWPRRPGASWPTTTPSRRCGRSTGSSRTSRRGISVARATGCGRAPSRRIARPRSRPSTRFSSFSPGSSPRSCRSWPRRSTRTSSSPVEPSLPDSVHLTRWPTADTAGYRDEPLEASMSVAMRAVELVRTLRAQAGLRTRQPIARLWLALPGGDIVEREALLALVAAEVNVKAIELIGDESELVERRVKVLLPKVGKRLGSKIPEVMAAARDGRFEIHADGSVTLAGVTVAADEVEIQASPKPGTAVAHDEGLVAVIDTELNPELLAEGDARELQRAIQDLRKDAGLALDDRIEVWVDGLPAAVEVYLGSVAVETLADAIAAGPPPNDDPAIVRSSVDLSAGSVQLAIRRAAGGRA